MVHALTHALGQLGISAQRLHLWRVLQYHLVIRPVGRILQIWRDSRVLSVEMMHMLSRHRTLALCALGLVILACLWLLSPHDLECLAWLQQAKSAGKMVPIKKMAQALSYWGDFLGFNMIVLLGVFSCSLLYRSRFLRLVVVASLLGSLFTGGSANVIRALIGRARPSAKVAPGFYGPNLQAQLHSCPSGHTATAFGGSIPVAVALPPVGVPLMITAGCIAWSRMYNNAHHPTDIVISMALASVFGIPLGLLARRMRRYPALRLQKYAALSSRKPASRSEVVLEPSLPPSSYVPHSDP